MTQGPTELILSRAELVYTLNALQTTHIVGMEMREFARPQKQFEALLREAEKSLIERSLLTVDNQSQERLLAPELVGMVGALAFRSLAFVLVRGVRGKGQQIFIFNRYRDIMVEHTFPREGTHRLALVNTLEDLLARVDSLVPLQPVIREGRPKFAIAQTEFEELQQRVQADSNGEALSNLVAAGLGQDLASVLIQALKNPLFTLSLACLKCERDTVVDAKSVAVFADEQSAWGVWQGTEDKGAPQLLIFPTGINDVLSALIDWLGFRDEQGPAI
jgi:hypothetical protein